MTYRELQQALKELRNQGITIFCKLNDSKEVLQSEYDRLQYVAPWDTQEDVDFDSDTVDNWGECFDTLPSDVFYSDVDSDSIEGTTHIDYNAPSLLDKCENENDSNSLELQISKLDAYIQTEVELQLANINYVTIDLDRIGYWIKCNWHVVDFTNYPTITLKTETVKGNDTLTTEENETMNYNTQAIIDTLTVEQFKAIISSRFPSLEGEFSERKGRLYFTTYRTLSGHRCKEYRVVSLPNGQWYVGTPFGGCCRKSLEIAVDAVKELYDIAL